MTQPKISIVLSVATEDYQKKWNFCLDTHKQYCLMYGYKYALIDPSKSHLHPKWEKIAIAYRFLKNDINVLLIDADAEITPSCPPYTDVLNQHLLSEIFYVDGNSGRPNSGVLILRGGKNSAATNFLQECLDKRTQPVPADCFVSAEGENGHVIMVLQQEKYRTVSLKLPVHWNCTTPEYICESFILHYTNKLWRWMEQQKNL